VHFHFKPRGRLISPRVTPLGHDPLGPLGPRRVDATSTPITVLAAPWPRRSHILAQETAQGSIAYILLEDGGLRLAYVGQTALGLMRSRSHGSDPQKRFADECVVIACTGQAEFHPEESIHLEWLLTTQIELAGRATIVGRQPRPGRLAAGQRLNIEELFEDARYLLLAAGCRVLEPRLGRGAGTREAEHAEPVSAGWTTDFPEAILEDPDRREYVLRRGKVEASCTVSGEWTVLRSGSLICREPLPSFQACLNGKRLELEEQGIIIRNPRRPEVGLLRLDVALPSLVNAARFATGTNASDAIWIEVPSTSAPEGRP
jgi:hypothetical protein